MRVAEEWAWGARIQLVPILIPIGGYGVPPARAGHSGYGGVGGSFPPRSSISVAAAALSSPEAAAVGATPPGRLLRAAHSLCGGRGTPKRGRGREGSTGAARSPGPTGAARSPREMGGPQPRVPPCWGSAVADANRLKPLFFGVKGDEKPSPGVRERRREDVTEPIYQSFLSSHVVPLRTARGGRFVPGAAPGEFGWRAGAEPGSAGVCSDVLGCQVQRWSHQVLLLGVLLLLLEPAQDLR